ncbi:DNA polymerase phi-domain-containing protein [Vararia minispora EC-137]|uniref:DNA polymerase phi-domain-containing protein n=1 Tax=Vararia minispora EC-137 TaxID=1314806 RepID=A0ACB8QJJ5_9AGAM|nr:DNA polymerase phi-domain-containing protein [Vararia minispora EC-137]
MSTTLPLFWDLSSADTRERVDASVKLVGALEKLQASFAPKDRSLESEEQDSGPDDHESDMLNLLNAADVSYSVRRLVRGLASPRESSRLGFAVALTELLSRICTVTCSQILAFVLDASHTTGSMSGQEERDMLFARLFGLTSIIQSGLLVRTQPLPSSASAAPEASSLAGYIDVLTHLVALGEKKLWLRESAWWSIGLAVGQLHASAVQWKDKAVDMTIQRVFIDENAWSPEKVALAVNMRWYWPKRDWNKLYAPTIKHGDVLHGSNTTALAKILKEVEFDDDNDESSSKKGARVWKPQVHYVWDTLLSDLLPTEGSGKEPRGSFQEFWRIVVDESLFAPSASNSRKYWGFEIVQKVLPRVREAELPMLFTKNFMRTWMNHLSQADRYLHKFAKQISASIQEVVQKNPEIGFAFVLQLTGAHGNQQFDKLTKTKTVESILTKLDAEGIKGYINHLLVEADGRETEAADVTNARRVWIVEQFVSLIRNGAIPKDDEWVQLVLDWFVVQGLFVIKKKSQKSIFRPLQSIPSPPFPDGVRRQCWERLLSCLAELTQQSAAIRLDDGKTYKIPGIATDGQLWISRVTRTIEQLEKDSKHVKLVLELGKDNVSLLQKARNTLSGLRQMAGEDEARRGAELLLCASVLLCYAPHDGQGSGDASNLEACIDGSSRLFKPSNKSPKKKSKNTDTQDVKQEGDPDPIDVLVDIIIGFLDKSTAFTRTVGNQGFSFLSGCIKASTVDLILAQLERKSSAELLADSDEDIGEDEQIEEGDGSELDEEDSDNDEEESEHDENEGDKEEVEVEDDAELGRKPTRAFGARAHDSDAAESDMEEMDDEQMMAIDEQLAAIFKEQTKGKRSGEFQREATHFKNRILDLLDIFMKKQPANPLVLQLILPILDLIFGSTPDEKQLAEKATGLLRSRIAKAKDVPFTGVDRAATTDLLNDLHMRARKARGINAIAALAACSLYVSRVLLRVGDEEAILAAYRTSLADFAERKASELNAKFFEELIKRHSTVAWKMRGELLAAASKVVNAYRQAQIYGLLRTLINGPSVGSMDAGEVLAFITSVHLHLHTVILGACTESSLSAGQLKDALTLALSAARQAKRLASVAWKPVSWADIQTRFGQTERFKASKSLHQLLCELVSISQGSSGNERDGKTVGPRKEGKGTIKAANEPGKGSKKRRKVDAEAEGGITSPQKKAKMGKQDPAHP